MGEVELVLAQAEAGADGVDRHPDLHAVAAGEGQRRPQGLDPQRALAGDRRPRLQAAAAADRPAGEAEREAEAAADPAGEGGDRDVALAPLDRLDQRRQLAAEAPRSPSQSRTSAGAGSALSAASAAAVTSAPLPCGRPRLTTCAPAAIATSAVPSVEASSATHSAAPGNAPRSAASVAAIRSASLRAATITARESVTAPMAPPYSSAVLHPLNNEEKEQRMHEVSSAPMADIEAHITGNVWKIEVAVGDEVSDGDTVVILESMKMEIPVEAEDDGVVKEILCEEGQSVSEGDVLVVLE